MSWVSYRYLWLGSLLCDSDVAWLNVMFVASEASTDLVIDDPGFHSSELSPVNQMG